MKIKGCVFDFGGVMTTATMPERVHPLVDELGVDWSVLEKGFAKYRRLMDGDFMTMEEMYSRIWADAGVSPSEEVRKRIVEEDYASFMYRNERTLDWMRRLKAQGFRIGILTNMCSDFAKLFRRHFADFIEISDATVISGEAKTFKPEKKIYDLLRERIGLEAGELCFFDDVEANCQGARDAGWQAIRFASNDQAERDFASMIAHDPAQA